MKKILLSFVLLGSFAAFAGDDCMALMQNPKGTYPGGAFLSAVGDGDSLSGAQSRAMAGLSAIFEVTIKNELSVRESSETKGGKEDYRSSISDVSKIQTNQKLMNVQFSENCTDKKTGKVYVIAYLDRAKTAPLYVEKIKELDAQVEKALSQAKAEPEPIKSFVFLRQAVEKARENEAQKKTLRIISDAALASLKDSRPLAAVADLLYEKVRDLPVSIAVQNDKDDRLKAAFDAAFKKMGFLETGAAEGKIRLNAVFTVEDAGLKNKYYNARWTLNLTLADQTGKTILTRSENQRATAVSAADAIHRSFKDAEKAIYPILNKAIESLTAK